MSDEIIKVLDALAEKFGIIIDWTQQNIQPYIQDLCHRIVGYELTTSIMWLIICTIAIIGSVMVIKKHQNKIKFDDCHDEVTKDSLTSFIYTIIAYCLIVIATIIIPFQISDICKCIFLPEKIVFEQIQFLTK